MWREATPATHSLCRTVKDTVCRALGKTNASTDDGSDKLNDGCDRGDWGTDGCDEDENGR